MKAWHLYFHFESVCFLSGHLCFHFFIFLCKHATPSGTIYIKLEMHTLLMPPCKVEHRKISRYKDLLTLYLVSDSQEK